LRLFETVSTTSAGPILSRPSKLFPSKRQERGVTRGRLHSLALQARLLYVDRTEEA
jgi:hypothetical protein